MKLSFYFVCTMWVCVLCGFLLFLGVKCEENVTQINFVTSGNYIQDQNDSVLERTVQQNNISGGPIKSEKTLGDFKPSPQLDVEYEYNKFPVVPAHPEAKRAKIQSEYASTEYPWRVKFPTEKERPYKFYNEPNIDNYKPSKYYYEKDDSRNEYSNKNFQKNDDFNFQKHVPVRQNSYGEVYSEPEGKYEYNMMERPSPIQKTGGYGHYGAIGGHYSENPWKKIIKILTAFIPIGLIISALTPTVITVSAANETQGRYRLADENMDLKKKLMSSINFFEGLKAKGCEERMICELLLAASTSPNAQENVKNFLDNFSEREDILEKTEDLKQIFAAVRSQNCTPIVCENIQNPP